MQKIDNEHADMRVSKTNYAISCAMAKILCEKELQKITVTELCSLAQINRKTFYTHFATTEDVFNYMLERIETKFRLIQLKHNTKHGYNLSGAVRDMIYEIDNNLSYLRNLANGTESNRILLDCIDFSIRIRMEFINPEEANRALTKRLQHFLNSGYVVAIFDWLKSNDNMSADELILFFEDIFLHIRGLHHMDNISTVRGKHT